MPATMALTVGLAGLLGDLVSRFGAPQPMFTSHCTSIFRQQTEQVACRGASSKRITRASNETCSRFSDSTPRISTLSKLLFAVAVFSRLVSGLLKLLS